MTWVLTENSPGGRTLALADSAATTAEEPKLSAQTGVPSHRIVPDASSRVEVNGDRRQLTARSVRPVAAAKSAANRGSPRRHQERFQTIGEVARQSLGNWMVEELTPTLVNGAVAGDPKALSRLIDLLTPLVQVRVARILLRRSAGNAQHDIRQDVEDFVQEVFIQLFADGAKVLRSWQTDRGLSLANFVGLVAERRVISILRSGRRNPWREEPTAPEELDVIRQDGPENQVANRDLLRQLLGRLQQKLSPLGWRLFHSIFVEEKTVTEIVAAESMTADAVYAWRSRLRRQAQKILRSLESES